MIAKEFLTELRDVSSRFEWRFYRRNQQIRASVRGDSVRQLFDPITATCFARTGKVFREDQWTEAASELGLSWIDAGDICAAANGHVTGGRPEESAYRQQLRSQMIEALLLDSGAPQSSVSPLHIIQDFFQSAFRGSIAN